MSVLDPQRLFDRAPCGLLTASLDGIVLSVNETFLEWSGYPREQVVGRYFLERLTRASTLFFETRFVPLLQNTGEVREVALQLERPDGSRLSLFVNARYEHEDRVIRMAVFDATARQDYERLLLESRRQAEAAIGVVRLLQEAAAASSSAVSEAQLSAALQRAMIAGSDASRAVFSVLGSDGVLVPVLENTPALDIAGERDATTPIVTLVPGPEQEAIRSGEPVRCSSGEELAVRFPEFSTTSLARRVEACCAVPVTDETGDLGVISVWFTRARPVSDELVDVLQALAALAAPVLRRLELQRRVEHLALNDRLTGLANRHQLEERLQQAVAAGIRRGRSVGVVFIDLDGFKAVNDTLGHIEGDRALREIAQALTGAVRRGDTLGRLGGDEFLIICEDVDDQVLGSVAERVRDAAHWAPDGDLSSSWISASVGLSLFRPVGSSEPLADPSEVAARLIQRADEAMYASKQAGKDQVTVLAL